MEKITPLKAYMLIKQTKGKTFTVKFIKKDNTLRTMNCRLGVRKDLTGKGMRYNPEVREMISVFDMQKGEYRMIRLSTLKEIRIGGEKFKVSGTGKEKKQVVYNAKKIKEVYYLQSDELNDLINKNYDVDFDYEEAEDHPMFDNYDRKTAYNIDGKVNTIDRDQIMEGETQGMTTVYLNSLCEAGILKKGTYIIHVI